ncbi:hypothetical protein [Shewanella surugensis]|uniref:Uncharacterized protein n=1 Tax=Shewanella surugensis TaxID=212020 RepID=A0ABT0LK26_9GAMM|nr:hypothetical protein [Shewanella surugensis]MCL1128057.1 hypothetical protein [Shewanella surugensis]
MMKIQGAVINEQGINFAIVVVKMGIVNSQYESEKAMKSFMCLFSGIPLILMAQDSRGTPKYRGRKDIVNFLSNIHPSRIPWKEYSYS